MTARRRRGGAFDLAISRRAVWTEYGGRKYRSKGEAGYAATLDTLKLVGEVQEWEPQVRIPCVVNGQKVCDYVADFRVRYTDGREEWLDYKGGDTQSAMYRLKKKLVGACTGIKIREV